MKNSVRRAICKSALAAVIAGCAAPASAELIFNPSLTTSGDGLGANPTVVTVLDAGATGNGTESGCISAAGAGTSFDCLNGLQGGDNQATNNLVPLSSLAGISSAGQLAFVVNLNEPGNDGTAVLTDLYLSFYSPTGELLGNHQYTGPDLLLQQVAGIGGAGSVFTLTAAEALAAAGECTLANGCRIGGGVQFLAGTANGGIDTLFLSFTTAVTPVPVPEPGSLALVGLGLAALAGWRRKKV